jgi:hypothetical protein
MDMALTAGQLQNSRLIDYQKRLQPKLLLYNHGQKRKD